jgi:hypothetical protein
LRDPAHEVMRDLTDEDDLCWHAWAVFVHRLGAREEDHRHVRCRRGLAG